MFNLPKYYAVAIFFLSFFTSSSQDLVKADSVRELLTTNNLTSEEKLEAYFWLSTYSGSPVEQMRYGNDLLLLANQQGDYEYIVKANYCIAVAQRFMGNLGKSIEVLYEGARVASEQDELKPLLSQIYSEISSTYTQNGDSQNALLFGSKAIHVLRNSNKTQQLALSLLNFGYDNYLIGNYDSAMAYYNESEPILKDVGLAIGLAYVKGNRALVFWKQGDLERAKEDLLSAISMLDPLGDHFGISDYLNQVANIYHEENNLTEAIKYASQGLGIAKVEGLKEQARDASKLLYLIYTEQKNFEEALKFQTQYFAYKDSIQSPETTQQIADLRLDFEIGQKQAELDLLLDEKRNSQIIMIVGGLILLIFVSFVIFRRQPRRGGLEVWSLLIFCLFLLVEKNMLLIADTHFFIII